jgi:hypothetical protein
MKDRYAGVTLSQKAYTIPPTPTKLPQDFAVAHHQNTIHPVGRRRVLKTWDKEGIPGGTRYELRQRVGVAGGPRRDSREKGLSRECSEAPRPVW